MLRDCLPTIKTKRKTSTLIRLHPQCGDYWCELLASLILRYLFSCYISVEKARIVRLH